MLSELKVLSNNDINYRFKTFLFNCVSNVGIQVNLLIDRPWLHNLVLFTNGMNKTVGKHLIDKLTAVKIKHNNMMQAKLKSKSNLTSNGLNNINISGNPREAGCRYDYDETCKWVQSRKDIYKICEFDKMPKVWDNICGFLRISSVQRLLYHSDHKFGRRRFGNWRYNRWHGFSDSDDDSDDSDAYNYNYNRQNSSGNKNGSSNDGNNVAMGFNYFDDTRVHCSDYFWGAIVLMSAQESDKDVNTITNKDINVGLSQCETNDLEKLNMELFAEMHEKEVQEKIEKKLHQIAKEISDGFGIVDKKPTRCESLDYENVQDNFGGDWGDLDI